MDRTCANCVHGGNCGDYNECATGLACWESDEGWFEVCHCCFGRGQLPGEGYADCPYCGGTGMERIEEPDGEEYEEEICERPEVSE